MCAMKEMAAKIALIAALLAPAVPAAAQSVKAGIEAWQRADYVSAVGIWRPLAEAEDADAAFNLGQAYRLGRGVPTNLAAAQTWLERAARKGHVDAQSTLGLLLFDTGNRVGGMRWLRSAAEQGEPRALLIYGTALFNGDGVARDPVLAYAYVSRAAAQGLAPAKTTLAQMDQLIPLDRRQKGIALARSKVASVKPLPAKVALAKPAKVAPTPRASTPAKTQALASVVTGGWRIQLGAFAKRESAEALFKRLSGSNALAARQPFYIAAGAVTRLQAGPYESRAAAIAACTALSAKGQPCFPVAVK
ncbi:MAG: SPOR domain-containing protein [Sphingomicrobium sp.]